MNGCLKSQAKSDIVNVVPKLHINYNHLSLLPTPLSHQLLMYARRDIKKDEELIWDYNLTHDPEGFT
jgi:SET domain-containing protein